MNEPEMISKTQIHRIADQQYTSSPSIIDHLAHLVYNDASRFPRLSKIVCTIGPSSDSVDMLFKLMQAGMNVARLNFSHGTHEYHAKIVRNVREAASKMAKHLGWEYYPVGIAVDTKGPEIRTGKVEDDLKGEIKLERGATVIITTDEQFRDKCNSKQIYVDCADITQIVQKGNTILMDDGNVILTVTKVEVPNLECEVTDNYVLGSHKGCNIPGVDIKLPAVSEKDKNDIKFAVELEADFIFASFIRNAAGVNEIRKLLGKAGEKIEIVSKIENMEGVRNIEEIIDASDGIMIARGDLGLNIPTFKIFFVQKTVIAKCQIAGIPAICATQMLDSMIRKPRPTRAEACDVANAVFDGSDCTMLSGETAKGFFPITAVKTMSEIIREAERTIDNRSVLQAILQTEIVPKDTVTAAASAAASASLHSGARAILVLSATGDPAFKVAKYRPRCPIIALIRDRNAARLCQLRRGILPLLCTQEKLPNWADEIESRVKFAIGISKEQEWVESGDTVILLVGWRKGPGFTNTLRIFNIE